MDWNPLGQVHESGCDVMRWPWQKREAVIPYKWIEDLYNECNREFQEVRFVELGNAYAAGRAMQLASITGSLKGTMLRAKDEGLA